MSTPTAFLQLSSAPINFSISPVSQFRISPSPPPKECARYTQGEWKIFNIELGELAPTTDVAVVRDTLIDFIIAKELQMVPCPWCRMPMKPEDFMNHFRIMADAGDALHIVAEIMEM